MLKNRRAIIRIQARHALIFLGVLALAVWLPREARAEVSGFLSRDGQALFPIGCYELPKDDKQLEEMAASGINLIRCRSKADLDRLASVGIQGWVSIPLHLGDSHKLRERVLEVNDHPALAVWEGPDEIVHSFTRYSGLYREKKIHKSRQDWEKQAPAALEYAEKQAAMILPGIRAGAKLIRGLDNRKRPIWMNEALNSDLKYMRQFVDSVDIIGCDLYPVKHGNTRPASVGDATEYWKQVGRGRKPVWMVLQAFSWHELGGRFEQRGQAYPSFKQSRLMAYDVIAHGAKGIMYWGSHYLKSEEFRQSLYALTSELAAVQPFLVAAEVPYVRVAIIETQKQPTDLGVRLTARKVGDEWLLILVNEDDRPHLGTEVSGLDPLNGRRLELLYGAETIQVQNGELITRMLPHQVKLFATSRKWETNRRQARDYTPSSAE